ncbi:MAG: response regulator [Gammaproteobacteria bacterium]|nr:response regulator [Gammaproteobacteria bacterium]
MSEEQNQDPNQVKFAPDAVLTTSQVAALMQVSVVTVEMWVRNQIIKASKASDGQDLYKYEDIVKHAEKHNIKLDGNIDQIIKVLIVDDDSFVADFLKDFLESRETIYEVHRTGISFMADTLMRKFAPHIVIVDLRMPGMNGIELCKTFSTQIEQGLRVVGISGHWTTEDKDAFISAGGEVCLNKPLDIQLLIAVLEENREYGEGYTLN